MPTGYTAAIKDGITFQQYAMNCARAFGALVMMRDEPADAPIPDEFQPSSWNADALAKARTELARLGSMSAADCASAAEADYGSQCDERERRLQEIAGTRAKYEAMLAQANAYVPPTLEHVGFKEFMVKQIVESIDFDCSTDYYEPPVRLSGEAWRADRLAKAQRDIVYHTEEHAKELERTASRNAWVSALRESLKQP